MEWIFVRHGETDDNLQKAFAGWTDSKLSKNGENQVKAVAKQLAKEMVEKDQIALYSSPLHRAKVLALAIEKGINYHRDLSKIEATFIEDLKEIHFGIFEGLSKEEVVERYPEEWQSLRENFGTYSIPEGETVEAFHSRVVAALKEIEKQGSEDQTNVVVTHGGVIQSALIHLLDLPLESRWHFNTPNGGIVKIEVIEGFGILKSVC